MITMSVEDEGVTMLKKRKAVEVVGQVRRVVCDPIVPHSRPPALSGTRPPLAPSLGRLLIADNGSDTSSWPLSYPVWQSRQQSEVLAAS